MLQSKARVLAVGVVLSALPLFAAQRTFVASSGNDANPCSRDLPCRSFTAAIAQTSANGEVVALDSAGYGPMAITQGVTIVAAPGVHAGISVFTGDGVTINAGSTDRVILRNLYINSQGGSNGIILNSAGKVHIEHCVVSGFSFKGIKLIPTNDAKVAISDTVVRQVASSGIYAGNSNALSVSIDRCRLEGNNGDGVLADSGSVAIGNSTADGNLGAAVNGGNFFSPVIIAVEACVFSNNNTGVFVAGQSAATVHNTTALHNLTGYYAIGGYLSLDNCVASGGSVGVHVQSGVASIVGCTIADNSGIGVQVSDFGHGIVSRNTITRNDTGMDSTGGTLQSAGDNIVEQNTTTNANGTIGSVTKV